MCLRSNDELYESAIENTDNVLEIQTLHGEHDEDISPIWSLHTYTAM